VNLRLRDAFHAQRELALSFGVKSLDAVVQTVQ
jgi:hypothetical protein